MFSMTCTASGECELGEPVTKPPGAVRVGRGAQMLSGILLTRGLHRFLIPLGLCPQPKGLQDPLQLALDPSLDFAR